MRCGGCTQRTEASTARRASPRTRATRAGWSVCTPSTGVTAELGLAARRTKKHRRHRDRLETNPRLHAIRGWPFPHPTACRVHLTPRDPARPDPGNGRPADRQRRPGPRHAHRPGHPTNTGRNQGTTQPAREGEGSRLVSGPLPPARIPAALPGSGPTAAAGPAPQARSRCPVCSPSAVPGGIAKCAEPTCLMYSLSASSRASAVCTGMKAVRMSRW